MDVDQACTGCKGLPLPMHLRFKASLSYLTDLFKFDGWKVEWYTYIIPNGFI